MSLDRGELVHNHLLTRLAASRTRPKRQYFIQQIGHLWRPSIARCCVASPQIHHHHAPTVAAIHVVASFANDSSPQVRIAVARTLGTDPLTATTASDALEQLLSDVFPVVRIVAANSLLRTQTTTLLNEQSLLRALSDSTWSVRWAVSAALAGTPLHQQAWQTLATSIPRQISFLDDWSGFAAPFPSELRNDSNICEFLKQQLTAHSESRIFGFATRKLVAACCGT